MELTRISKRSNGIIQNQAELSGTGSAPKLASAGLNVLVCLLPAQPMHTHPWRIPQRAAPPCLAAAEGHLFYGWV